MLGKIIIGNIFNIFGESPIRAAYCQKVRFDVIVFVKVTFVVEQYQIDLGNAH